MKRGDNRPPAEAKVPFAVGGREIYVTVRRSRRARRVRLEVSARRGVVLVVPKGVPQSVALQFLEMKKKWLRKQLTILEGGAGVGNFEKGFVHPPRLLYFGKRIPVEVELEPEIISPGVEHEEKRLVLKWPALKGPNKDELVWAFEAFYRWKAIEYFSDVQWRVARRMGLDVSSPTIRGQKTRWGSYSSSSGRVSLNWKLMMAPRRAIRYVIVHELCHVLEPNHSPRFWKHVEEICPDFRVWRTWLNGYSDLIHRLATFEHLEGLFRAPPFTIAKET